MSDQPDELLTSGVRSERGFTLIEVMVALMIAVVISGAALGTQALPQYRHNCRFGGSDWEKQGGVYRLFKRAPVDVTPAKRQAVAAWMAATG